MPHVLQPTRLPLQKRPQRQLACGAARFPDVSGSTAKVVSTKNLGIYLNDHLAGSVAALELAEYLSKNYPDTALETFLAELHVRHLRGPG